MRFDESKLAKRMRERSEFESQPPRIDDLSVPELQMLATGLTSRLSNLFKRWLDRTTAGNPDLNGPRLRLLGLVASHKTVTMSEAAVLLDVTPRAITRLVDGLEADGFLQRQPNSVDKRVFELSVTPVGQERIEKLMPGHLAQVRELFSELTAEELQTYIQLNFRLMRKLKSQEFDR
ncbi:MAG: MarR family winged helix-turn-helix transcriptional regulator [Micrococcales bacterium]